MSIWKYLKTCDTRVKLFIILNFKNYPGKCGDFDQLNQNCGSSHQRCSLKKGDFKNFPKFLGNHLCQGLLFNKVAGLRLQTSKIRLWHKCLSVNFWKFPRTLFYWPHSGDCFWNWNFNREKRTSWNFMFHILEPIPLVKMKGNVPM